MIDLARAHVMDSDQGGDFDDLSSVLVLTGDGTLAIDVDAAVSDGDSQGQISDVLLVQNDTLMIDGSASIVTDDTPDGAVFDYEYDADGDVFGAGTAFLQE